ncbi:MAG: DMT family transporter [Actinomycetota bacterium]|nr:DMT family transporter [Actinomycetota bacterium]
MSRLAALRIIPTEKVAGLLLLTGAAFWGLTFPAAKEALEIMGPLAFMTWSRAVGFISLVPLAWGTPRDRWREALPLGLLLGVLLFFAYLFQTLGLERTTATNAGFLTGLYVVGTPLFGAAIYRRWPSVRVLVAVAMSTVGLALLSLRGWSFSPGDSLVMLSVVFWSLQILAVGRGTQRDPVVLILVEMAFATILHAASSGFDLQFDALPRAWPYLIITGVLGTGLAYFVQIIGQRRISPTRTAIIYTGEPVFAAFFSALWLGERLNARGWAGAALIVAAMIVAETGGRDSVAEAAPDPARQGP